MNNDIAYKFTIINNEIRLDKYVGNETNVLIPSIIKGLKVKEVNNNCFYKNNDIQSINFNDVEYISQLSIVNCENLNNINFGTKCKNLLYNTVVNCPNLSHITLSTELEYINPYFTSECFNIKSITTNKNVNFKIINNLLYDIDKRCVIRYIKSNEDVCKIPVGTRTIESGAFFNANNLKRIEFNEELETIELNVFENCSLLEDIYLKRNIIKIGTRAFANCVSLKTVKIDGTLSNISSGLFYNCNNLISLDIANEDKIEIVHSQAFFNCNKLSKLPKFPNLKRLMLSALMEMNSLEELNYCNLPINKDCFIYDTNIIRNDTLNENNSNVNFLYEQKNIEINKNVTEIPSFAFERFKTINIGLSKDVSHIYNKFFNDCCLLENVFVDEENEVYSSVDGILLSKDMTKIIYHPFNSKVDFIDNVTEICEWAYQSSKKIFTFNNFPKTVKKIGIGAFEKSSLETVIINTDLDILENFAFAECENIKVVRINGKVNYFGNALFKNCINLKELYISPINKDSTFGNPILENNPNIEFIDVPNITGILDRFVNYNLSAKITYNS